MYIRGPMTYNERTISKDEMPKSVRCPSNFYIFFTRARVVRGNGTAALSKHDASYCEI